MATRAEAPIQQKLRLPVVPLFIECMADEADVPRLESALERKRPGLKIHRIANAGEKYKPLATRATGNKLGATSERVTLPLIVPDGKAYLEIPTGGKPMNDFWEEFRNPTKDTEEPSGNSHTPVTRRALGRAWDIAHRGTSRRDAHPQGRRMASKPSQRRARY